MSGFLSDQELDAAIKAAVFENAHPVDESGDRVNIGGVGLEDAKLVKAMRDAFLSAGWSKPDGV